MKRSRVLNTKQSKFGCYTCKKRRIKCDETRPTCMRCERSKLLCGGYPPGALGEGDGLSAVGPESSSSSLTLRTKSGTSKTSNLPIDRFSLMPGCTDEQVRLCQLACTVLGADPHQIYCPSNAVVFGYLIPQLTLSVPFVAVAAAAFGAAYESTLLHENSIDAAKASTSQYLNALQLLQSELHSPNGDHVPLIIASVLLAASEAVQHHEQDALSHVIGAFSLHTLRDKNTVVENQQSPYGACQIGSEEITDSLLEDVFRSIDVQISTFLWRRQPFFGMKQLVGPLPARTNIEEVIYDQPALLHSSVHFLSKVLQDGCQYLDDFSPSLVHEQEHLISMLHIWLTNCNELLKKENMPEKSPFTKAQVRHLHLLRCQALGILIAVSNINTQTQMSYDKYEKQFGQMLKSAELVLAPAKANSSNNTLVPPKADTSAPLASEAVSGSGSMLVPFTPSPGIIQPLFFLAQKCRNPLFRRRAISLLRGAGIEGPFNGSTEAEIAQRIVELEEDRPYKSSLDGDDDVLLTQEDIPDSRRIISCCLVCHGLWPSCGGCPWLEGTEKN